MAKLALKAGATVLNDDRIILRRENKGYKIYGTPWHGEVGECLNRAAAVENIFFLVKSKENRLEPMSKTEAATELFKNIFHIFTHRSIMKKIIWRCMHLAGSLNCYRLHFRPDGSIWRFLDEMGR